MATVFFSYSHKDETLRDAIEVHLAMLKREDFITALHDRRINAGEVLDDAIDEYIETADIVLCLVSPDFIASDYCYSREMTRALERHDAKEALVVPIILRHCEWKQTPLSKLRATPTDAKPVKAWSDQDEALNVIASDIRKAVAKLNGKSTPSTNRSAITQVATGKVEIVSRPRSANLRIKHEFSDKERDDYLRSSFDQVAEVFANSVDELGERHPDIEGRFTRLDPERFTASLYRQGKKVSGITIFLGGMFGKSISYHLNDSGSTIASNGAYQLSDANDEQLQFTGTFGHNGAGGKNFNSHALAEEIWGAFIEPLQ